MMPIKHTRTVSDSGTRPRSSSASDLTPLALRYRTKTDTAETSVSANNSPRLDADRFVGGGGDTAAVQRRERKTSRKRESSIDRLGSFLFRRREREDPTDTDATSEDGGSSAVSEDSQPLTVGERLTRTLSKASVSSQERKETSHSSTSHSSFRNAHMLLHGLYHHDKEPSSPSAPVPIPRAFNDEILAPYAPQGKLSVASSVTSQTSLGTNDSGDRDTKVRTPNRFLIGICALDAKARSKPMRNILNRLLSTGEFETVIFGDKVILDEPVEKWPKCDFLISFFSNGFPLDKAIAYVNLCKPVCVNDLSRQKILWDRRCVLAILDKIGVPTPRRVEVNRDGGPKVDKSIADGIEKQIGLRIDAPLPDSVVKVIDEDTISVDGKELKKPFVEKPVSGENHNIHIYYSKAQGGGARRLFRKIGNKSSEFDPDLTQIRTDGSYIYEEFMASENMEDVKVYTIGPTYCHAETRKSPVVDGLVRRNNDGKEIRFITKLTDKERRMAARIATTFGQSVCGYDLLRTGNSSYVIDVNGWSFVKGNDDYYDNCARLLREMFLTAAEREHVVAQTVPESDLGFWTLKAFVAVFRHADRTPKQKARFNFISQPFVDLLQGHREEVVLRVPSQLDTVLAATRIALIEKSEDVNDLKQLENILLKKKPLAGTKVQVKPSFDKKTDELTKIQVIVKWGGEFTHAALYQSKDLGENLRKDMMIMNKDVLNDIEIYTSSERRVSASAEIFAASFLQDKEFHPDMLQTRKDLLDDSNAAKDMMDDVKKRLKTLLRPGSTSRDEFAWPEDMPEPSQVVREIIELMKYHRQVLEENYRTLDVDAIQSRWCCAEDPRLFYERWQKLFKDFCDVELEKFDPGRVSELYDSMKYDALHNAQFLNTIFVPAKLRASSPTASRSPSKHAAAAEDEDNRSKLKEMFSKAKMLFDLVAPQEYGITNQEKLEIGLLVSMPLLSKIVQDLHEAQESDSPRTRLYFTKESHIHTLLNCVLQSGMPMKRSRVSIPELDYLTQITFEVYTRTTTREDGTKEREDALRVAFSEGAHASNLLDTQLDSRHCLNVAPRKNLTKYLELEGCFIQFNDNLSRIQERIRKDGWHPSTMGPTVLSAPGSNVGSADASPQRPSPISMSLLSEQLSAEAGLRGLKLSMGNVEAEGETNAAAAADTDAAVKT